MSAFRPFCRRGKPASFEQLSDLHKSTAGINARMQIATTVFNPRKPPKQKRPQKIKSRIGYIGYTHGPSLNDNSNVRRQLEYEGVDKVEVNDPYAFVECMRDINARKDNTTTATHKCRPLSKKHVSYAWARFVNEQPFHKRRRQTYIRVNRPMRNGGRHICALWDIFNDPGEFPPLSFKDYALMLDGL